MRRNKPGIGADFEQFLHQRNHNQRIKKIKNSSPKVMSVQKLPREESASMTVTDRKLSAETPSQDLTLNSKGLPVNFLINKISQMSVISSKKYR